MTLILPDAPEVNSGWHTKNHYFYEIVNWKRKRVKSDHKENTINFQLALSGKNIPNDLRRICDKIEKKFPSKRHYDNWFWRIQFSTERVVIPFDMSENDILALLDAQYNQLQEFEKRLVEVMTRM